MQWYYTKGGVQTGPLEESELRSRIANGEITQADLIWRDGMANWLPLSQVPELSNESVATNSTAAPNPFTASAALNTPIPTYLWQSIVVTLMCCWPLGIPAIIHAAKVDGLVARGDLAAARQASNTAKKWCIWSMSSGLIIIVLYFAAIAIAAATGNLK